ncbi:MAG: BON domain-containing protein, partial [Terracidiphilus sp.]
MLKRVFPRTLAFAALAVLCATAAMAQNAGTAPAPAARTDGQIEMDVVHTLDGAKALKSDLITVATIQGEVTLSGTVSSEASSELAESIASHVPGVVKVHNNLKIGNPHDAADAGESGAQQETDSEQADSGDQPAVVPAPAPAPAPDEPRDHAIPRYPQGIPQYPQTPRPRYTPPPPAYQIAKDPVAVPAGTLLVVRTAEAIDSKHAKDGQPVEFTVIRDVTVGGLLAIPRGATVRGFVSDSKQAGALAGSAELALKLTAMDLAGETYQLDTDSFKVKGPNKAGQTFGSAVGGSIVGAIIGCAAGRRE